MKRSHFVRLALLVCTVIFSPHLLSAQDLAVVRERMEKRQTAIKSLMNRHVAGENNRGFLEVRGSVLGDDQQVISDENTDRRKVYAALAKETGETVDEVGRQRAVQLVARALRGHWVQDPSGDWRQK